MYSNAKNITDMFSSTIKFDKTRMFSEKHEHSTYKLLKIVMYLLINLCII